MANVPASYFHLHLVSDSTGETLTTIAKAAAVQYQDVRPIEHVYPLIRTRRQMDRVLQEIGSAPGIVLYTIVNKELTVELERRCRELGTPCLYVLEPIMKLFESYLGAPATPIVAGQHRVTVPHRRGVCHRDQDRSSPDDGSAWPGHRSDTGTSPRTSSTWAPQPVQV